jgi:hypothetical protein
MGDAKRLLDADWRVEMTTLTMLLPDETSLALKVPSVALGDEIRMAAAMKLFELGRLSSGAAAALAGISKPVFLSKLGGYGIPAFVSGEQELVEDMNNA